MANMTTDTLTKANGPVGDFKGKIQHAENQLEKFAQNTGEKIGSMASDIANTTSDYVNTGRDYVKENPVKGVAIAAATGAVIGSLVTLAMRSRKH